MTTPSTNYTKTIGKYTILETIGIGSFGKVKLAITQSSKKVALKIINKKRLEEKQRLKREIKCMKLLRHPHIIELYEVISTPTEIIMVMEYAEGKELFNYILSKGKLEESEARRFFQQIISAVEYCHLRDITHRDLKPENLLLTNNSVKIADFGLSNLLKDGDFLSTSCGSPNYAAPEVINGKLYGKEVDIWSCGVILFAMICGKLPFDDEYIPSLFRKINEGIYSIPVFVSDGARELISKMLVVDPLKRISIKEIRETEWFILGLPDYLKNENEVSSTPDLESAVGSPSFDMVIEDDIKSAASSFDSKRFLNPTRLNPLPNLQVIHESNPYSPFVISVKRNNEPNKVTYKYHLGLRSKSSPKEIMSEVYECLRKCGMEWGKGSSIYVIPVRKCSTKNELRFEVWVYKVEKGFSVDFKMVEGSGMDFLEGCCSVIRELAIQ